MYFLDQLTASVRDHGLALGRMIVTTEPTARQEKARELLAKFYVIVSHVFFLGIMVTFFLFVLLQVAGSHAGLVAIGKSLAAKLPIPALAVVILGPIVLLLLLLRGLLYLFQVVSAVELTKFYLFLELVNLAHQHLSQPAVQPVPFLVAMLRKLLDVE
jgi:hypothetical protein